MVNLSSQPEPELPVASVARRMPVPVQLRGTTSIDVVPAEYYVEELWAALDKLRPRFHARTSFPWPEPAPLDGVDTEMAI